MKIIKLSSLIIILSISISCEKKEEVNPLVQDLQNGFWEAVNDNEVLKFDGTKVTFYGICETDDCSPNFPCVSSSNAFAYTIEGNTITLPNQNETLPIKVEADILTVNESFVYERKSTLGYSDC